MPLFLLLSAQLSLPVISRKIITPPDHTYGTVSVRNIYCNMCRGRTGHKPRAWLALCQPRRDALVPQALPAGVVHVSPWRCHRGGVPIVAGGLGANCAWWPRAVQHPLPQGGTGKALPLPSLSPTLFPKDAGGLAGMWGCAEPQLVKLQGSRTLRAAPCWGHLRGGLRAGGEGAGGALAPSVSPGALSHLWSCQLGTFRV